MSGDAPFGPRAPTGEDDAALVLAIASGRDRAAFVALFARFAPRLKSLFLRGGTSAQHAEDLVQETMLSVWRKADSFDPARAGVATWIFSIARNQRIDALRRSSRQVLDDEDPSLAPAAPTAPDAAFDQVERDGRIRIALSTLTADQIDVVRLSFFEDRPHAEIERVLGVPLGTVKSRLRLAMNRLRASLGEYRPPPRDGVERNQGGEMRQRPGRQASLGAGQPSGDRPIEHPPGAALPAGEHTAGAPTAGAPTAGAHTAGAPTAGAPTAGAHTAGDHTAGDHPSGDQSIGEQPIGDQT